MSRDDAEPQMLRSAAYLPVADVERAAHHYETVLGFQREYGAGQPLEFAIVRRDAASIMLRRVSDARRIVPNEAQGGTWDVFVWVRDLASLHAELASRGARFVYGPTLRAEYGMHEMAVRDADGHVLGFGQPVSTRP